MGRFVQTMVSLVTLYGFTKLVNAGKDQRIQELEKRNDVLVAVNEVQRLAIEVISEDNSKEEE